MLMSRDAIADVVELVKAEHFYRPAHARVFEAVSALFAAGEPADAVTVAEALGRAEASGKALEAVGGLDGLLGMQVNTPVVSNWRSYARIVRDNFLLRRLIEVGGEVAEIGYTHPGDVADALDQAETLVFQIAKGRISDSAMSLQDVLTNALDRMEDLYEHKLAVTGTPTGYTKLDELLAGLQPGSLYIVGARPSVGKTALALGMAQHAAVEAKKTVLVFSMEMSEMELAQRVLSANCRIESSKLRTGRLTQGEWDQITFALNKLGEAPLWIDDSPNLTVMEIRARARRLRSQVEDLSLVVVDYLQLMTGRSRADNRQVEVAEISRGLKILARELECPVVALSQLSRGLESRKDRRPQLSDLRESGAIEQDADVVIFIYREEVYSPKDRQTSGTAEIIVAKNRNGPTRMIKLAFIPRHSRFANFADSYDI